MIDNFFTGGPFRDARENVLDFTLGIYYSYCFGETMNEFLKVQNEYLLALSSSDEALIEVKRSQLSYYENIITLATTGLFHGIESVPEDEAPHD
jgi:hypothetical protein